MSELWEKKTGSRTIYEGRILDLICDDVRLPNGEDAKREVVVHSGGVAVLALTDQNEVLVVEQYRYPFSEVLLEIPAGKRNPDEEPRECGIRELKEETGAVASSFTPFGVIYPTPAYVSEKIHLFLARGLTFTEQSLDPDEFLEVKKIPLHTLGEMVMAGQVPDAKTQIAVLKALKQF